MAIFEPRRTEPRLTDLIDRAVNRATDIGWFLFMATRHYNTDDVVCFSTGLPDVLDKWLRDAGKYSLGSWGRGTKPKNIEPRVKTSTNVDSVIAEALNASLDRARMMGCLYFCEVAPPHV